MFTPHGAGRRRIPAQADELPVPHPDLRGQAAQLPRPAGAAGRARHGLPLRALRRAARPDPRARLHPGRRAHLLHAGPDRGRDRGLPAVRHRHAARPSASTSTTPSFPPGTAARAASTTARPSSGSWPRTRCSGACERLQVARQGDRPTRPPSTGPRSTSSWWTRSAARGSSPPSSSISPCRARFDLEYIGEDGKAHQPLMVHRALFGSIERFFGILIEHYAGAFPVWLAPVQAIVLPITDRQTEYARSVQRAARRRRASAPRWTTATRR